jgi:hypothetical protein
VTPESQRLLDIVGRSLLVLREADAAFDRMLTEATGVDLEHFKLLVDPPDKKPLPEEDEHKDHGPVCTLCEACLRCSPNHCDASLSGAHVNPEATQDIL